MILYTVRCTFTDAAVAERWAAWLREEHLAEVVAAGALRAELVRLDATEPTFEARYRFADRATYARYEVEAGPRLRAAGLARFPLALGLSYSRSVGEQVAAYPAESPSPR